jgi:hypothetical protein
MMFTNRDVIEKYATVCKVLLVEFKITWRP